jgi:hypothetical protein
MLTILEQAELLVSADVKPDDVRERLAALEKEADPRTEKPFFGELWEVLDTSESEEDVQ